MWLKVLYDGGVRIRLAPSGDAAMQGEILPKGYIFEADEHITEAESSFVQLCDKRGWVYEVKDGVKILQRVEAPQIVKGEWWYRVIHPQGMCFAKHPEILAERHEVCVPCGATVRAIEKHTPAASAITFVLLENGQGWLFESTASMELLDRLDGEMVLEAVKPESRTSARLWAKVVKPTGVEVLRHPIRGAQVVGRLTCGAILETIAQLQPAGSDRLYFQLAEDAGWALAAEAKRQYTEMMPAPMDEDVDMWFRVMYIGGVTVRMQPALHAPKGRVVLPYGCYVRCDKRHRPPGSNTIFLRIAEMACASPEKSAAAIGTWVFDELQDGSQTTEVMRETRMPTIERTEQLLYVMYQGGIALRKAPHVSAAKLPVIVPAYEAVVCSFMITSPDGQETFALLSNVQPYCDILSSDPEHQFRWLVCKIQGNQVAVPISAPPSTSFGRTQFRMARPDVAIFTGPNIKASRAGTVSLPPGSILECDRLVKPPGEEMMFARLVGNQLYVLVQHPDVKDLGLEEIKEEQEAGFEEGTVLGV